MEETIKKGIEEFNKEQSNDCVLGRYIMSFLKKHDTFKDKEEVLKENKKVDKIINDYLKTFAISILKAQNKELRKEKRTMRAAEETGSDVGAGYTIGFNRALKDQIERNNKIINNLSK